MFTYYLLQTDKDIDSFVMKSYIQEQTKNDFVSTIILSVLFPITLPYYLNLKKPKINMKTFIYSAIFVVLLYGIIASVYTFATGSIIFNNTVVDYQTQFEQKKQERITFYSKMYAEIVQSSEITVRNDSSFQNLVNIVMVNQPKSLSGMLSAFKLIDPSVNYEQVSKFYENLNAIVSNNRSQFLSQEIQIQTIVRDHNSYIQKFPANLYNKLLFNKPPLQYTPILTEAARDVDKTGIEKEVHLFK